MEFPWNWRRYVPTVSSRRGAERALDRIITSYRPRCALPFDHSGQRLFMPAAANRELDKNVQHKPWF